MTRRSPGRPEQRRAAAALWLALPSALLLAPGLAGCHAARVLAPPPPLRAVSANDFAVELEFAEPLDRAVAEDISHYVVHPGAPPGTPQVIFSATMVDSVDGRVVLLLISDGPLADSSDYVARASGLVTVEGRPMDARSVTFRTGLTYRAPLRQLFDAHCSSCHGAGQASGSYRTDSYAALYGNGTDATPDLVAGDPACLLVRKTKARNSMFNRGNLSYLDSELIRNWVVSYGARP